MDITRKQVSLFHIIVIVPILGYIGWRIVTKKKLTMFEGYTLLLLAAIALFRHLQLFLSK